jgi:urease accessory protein
MMRAGLSRAGLSRAEAARRIFSENRAAGRIALTVAAETGATRRQRVYEDGPLRVRFPNGDGQSLDAVIVNTAGGIAGGDRHDIAITVSERARLTVTTAAAEKVYRSHGPDAEIDIKLSAGAGANLAWLPQETILFDQARLARRIEVELAGDATLLLAEAVVFGRAAMGEAVTRGAFADVWRVRRGGALVFAESVRVGGDIAARLAEPAVAGGGYALATVLAIPGDAATVERVRGIADFCGEVGVSCWNGLAAARLCAKDGAALRRDLAAVVTAIGGTLPRLWLQ